MSSSSSETGAATELTAGRDGAATEHTEVPQLAEVVNQEAGFSTEIELKVIRNELIAHTYIFKGNEVATQKLQIVLQSKIPEKYCLAVAKLKHKDKAELKKLADRWQTGSTCMFKDLTLLNEKPLISTHHAASQSICACRRCRCCYRAHLSGRRQCQQFPSQTPYN